jgi:putative transposon-encoded protein
VTKRKLDINAMTGFATKQGNGAHVMVPKEWIGVELFVTPLVKMQEAELKKHKVGLRRGKITRKRKPSISITADDLEQEG